MTLNNSTREISLVTTTVSKRAGLGISSGVEMGKGLIASYSQGGWWLREVQLASGVDRKKRGPPVGRARGTLGKRVF